MRGRYISYLDSFGWRLFPLHRVGREPARRASRAKIGGTSVGYRVDIGWISEIG